MRRGLLTLLFGGLVLCLFFSQRFSGQSSSGQPEVEITGEPSHHLTIENADVRAFRVEVAPRTATLMHRHRHDYVFVTIGNSWVRNEVAGKAPVELKLADGEARFVEGNFAHVAYNLADQPFRNVTIEFLRAGNGEQGTLGGSGPQKDGSSGAGAATDSSGQVFPSGHIKTLFVKDGVRVSENELGPGATIPHHRHERPHLVVAVSDLNLRSDVDGKEPVTRTFKAGEAAWVPGGFAHTLTNTGTQTARFVTLEF